MKLFHLFFLLFFTISTLTSCAGFTHTGIISGDANTVSIRINEWGTLSEELGKAYLVADSHCAKYGKYSSEIDTVTGLMKTSYFNCFNSDELLMMECEGRPKIWCDNVFRETWGVREHPLTEIMHQPITMNKFNLRYGLNEENSISSDNLSDINKSTCESFGFLESTPEMANCMLELYKIANQPQQSTQTVSEPARSDTDDSAAAIELFNISRNILNNTGTRTAPAPTSVRCARIGDFSRQVYTFNGIACPIGYASSF